MSDHSDYTPRLAQRLTMEQHQKLQDLVPWGTRTELFSALIDDLISVLEAGNSRHMANDLIEGKIKLRRVEP